MAEPRTKEMPSSAGVRVRNLLRRRAVLMNLPGGASLRLGPGEAAEISEQQARSRECARFCRDGVLQIEGAKTAPAESPPAAVPPEEVTATDALEVGDESAPKPDDEAGTGLPPGVADEPAPSEPKTDKASAKTGAKPAGRRKDAAGSKDDEKPPRGRKGKGDDTDQ